MNNLIKILLLLIMFNLSTSAQVDSLASGKIDVYLLDSYITPEIPHKFVLTFLTSDSCFSKVQLIGDNEFQVSKELTDNHKIEIDISSFQNIKKSIQYKIFVWNRNNEKSESQFYDVEIPQAISVINESNEGLLQLCCMGGIIFGLPSPTFVFQNGKNYFSLTKEIPLFSFYSGSFNYPLGYISVEYAHIFKSDKKNFLRIGYKHIFQIQPIEYLSVGLNFFSDMKGFNGVSPEFSVGLFQIKSTLTVFAKYRYNFKPSSKQFNFSEISIGLYSSFFSLNF